MFTRFSHVVFLIELAKQFFKNGTHCVVVESWQTNIAIIVQYRLVRQVYLVVRKFLDDTAQTFCLCEVIHHLAQMELIDDVLHILAEAIQIVCEIHLQSQRVSFALQRLHRKLRCIEEWIVRYAIKDWVLILDVALIKLLLHGKQRFLCWLQQHINAPKHHHGHDDFLILAFLEGIHKHICSNVPDEREQLVVLTLVHIR